MSEHGPAPCTAPPAAAPSAPPKKTWWTRTATDPPPRHPENDIIEGEFFFDVRVCVFFVCVCVYLGTVAELVVQDVVLVLKNRNVPL